MHSSTGWYSVAYWQKAVASSLTILSLVAMTAGPLLTPATAFANTEHHQSYHDGHEHDGDTSHHDGDDNDQGDDHENDDNDGHGGHVKGSITVCKILVDATGAPINGATLPATTFSIAGAALPHHTLPTTVFTTPLALTQHFLDSSEGDDAACKTYTHLKLGSYHYGAETITSTGDFEAPLYNDQFTTAVHSTSDFFALDNSNTNTDGVINLTKARPNRTLVVLNKVKAPACDATEVAHTEKSDTGTVDTTDAHPAVILSFIHANWLQVLGSASWIWSDNPVTNPGSNDAKVFTKTFTVVGTPTAASIDIAADNHYVLKVNGTEVANPAEPEHNYEASVNYPITLVTGVNTIEVTVNNIGIADSSATDNPAGLIFEVHYTANECVTPPSFLKVHILKYLTDGETTTQVADDSGAPAFPMTSSWSATNIGSGSGSYVLGTAFGGASSVYAADTASMSAPADYSTAETTDGSVVLPTDSECQAGKYRLVGYKTGDTLSAAENASVTTSVPTFTGLTADKYVIVVNEQCVTPPPACDATVNLLTNPSFEANTVAAASWNIFPSGSSPLAWLVDWFGGATTFGDATRPEVANAEIQNNGLLGVTASDGSQWTELDSDWDGNPGSGLSGEPASVAVHQAIATIPGYTYTVGYDFMPRPSTSAGENKVEALYNGLIGNTADETSGAAWSHHTFTFVATSSVTDIAFRDAGTPSNSLGSFLDNASVKCQPPVVPPPNTATISATKIVCDAESYLPNWGEGGADITATTAADFLATGTNAQHCHLADWTFDWSADGVGNPGDNVIGSGGAGWTSFTSTATVPAGARLWVREEPQTGYVPFSYNTGETANSNANNVSAELYCSNDVLNYDNWDFVDPVVAGQTYHCVGFNAPVATHEGDGDKATLTIVKHTVGGDGKFYFDVTGEDTTSITTNDGTGTTDVTLDEGAYNVTEQTASGWTYNGVSCVYDNESVGNVIEQGEAIDVEAGDHVTCTFTNTKNTEIDDGGGSDPITCATGTHLVGDTCVPNGGGGPIQGFSFGGGGNGPISGGNGQVLGASCGIALNQHLRKGSFKNNVEQVKILQGLLNKYVGTNLPITGVFGPLTEAAVKAFQAKYVDQILKPWGLSAPTGLVYLATLWKLDDLECPDATPPFPSALIPWSANPNAQ